MVKKYPLKQVLIYRNFKMEITLNEKETMAVIEAGLKATNLAKDIAITDINVTQSRKTGKATIALEVSTPFGSDEDLVEPVQMDLPLDEEITEEVVEEAESALLEQVEETPLTENIEEKADTLFGDTTSDTAEESDSLFG